MIDLPARLLPPALLGGLAVYGAVTLVWLQPIVETRMAEKHLIPKCEVNLQHAEDSVPVPDDPKRRELEMLIAMYESMGRIPMLDGIVDELKRQLQYMKPSRIRISNIDRTNICGCAVDNALDGLGLKMTLHVASLRTHTPNALKAIDKHVLSIAGQGQCGKLPWK